jgi:hypothetical protein
MKLYKIGFRKFIIVINVPKDLKEFSNKLKEAFPKYKFIIINEIY